MRVIWKYTIPSPLEAVIEMPQGAVLLMAGAQDDAIVVWAEVDPAAPKAHRVIFTVNTGFSYFPDREMRFIGTVQMQTREAGETVWHVFDCGEETP